MPGNYEYLEMAGVKLCAHRVWRLFMPGNYEYLEIVGVKLYVPTVFGDSLCLGTMNILKWLESNSMCPPYLETLYAWEL